MFLNRNNFEYQSQISEDIYVDKSSIIFELNKLIGKRNKYICISRPRRFGKTMIAEMLCAYYSKGSDSKKLFNKKNISKYSSYKKFLNKYDTIYINFQNVFNKYENIKDSVKYFETILKKELSSIYSNVFDEKNDDLDIALEKIFNSNVGKVDFIYNGFIFIIDEWDAVLRNSKYKKADIEYFLDYIRLLFKDRIYIKLVYMTGILPIKKYGTHSALNMFIENTVLSPGKFGNCFGFVNSEVKSLNKNRFNFKDLKDWYDGYYIAKSKTIFNPKSVSDCFKNGSISNYWARTETFEALKIYIDTNFNGIHEVLTKLMTNEDVKIDTNSFQNDMTNFSCIDDILTLLVHIGYLTYNENTKSVCIPNLEIEEEFKVALKNGDRKELFEAIKKSDDLLDATLSLDSNKVSSFIEEIHRKYVDIKNYNREIALSNVVKLAYYISTKDRYVMHTELEAGDGYIDICYIPKKKHSKLPAIIVELKFDKSVSLSIEQIKVKKYFEKVKEYTDNIIFVGVSYDKKTKKHSCIIEKYGG